MTKMIMSRGQLTLHILNCPLAISAFIPVS